MIITYAHRQLSTIIMTIFWCRSKSFHKICLINFGCPQKMQFMDKWVKPGLAVAFDLVPQYGCIMDLVRIWILFAIELGLWSRILHLHPLIVFEKIWINLGGDIFRDEGTPPGWLCLVALRCFSCFFLASAAILPFSCRTSSSVSGSFVAGALAGGVALPGVLRPVAATSATGQSRSRWRQDGLTILHHHLLIHIHRSS